MSNYLVNPSVDVTAMKGSSRYGAMTIGKDSKYIPGKK